MRCNKKLICVSGEAVPEVIEVPEEVTVTTVEDKVRMELLVRMAVEVVGNTRLGCVAVILACSTPGRI